MTSAKTAERTETPSTVSTRTPSLTIGNQFGAYVVANNSTTIVYTYTSSTAIQPNTIHVTVSNFNNCYFGTDKNASSCKVPVVPDPHNSNIGYAKFTVEVDGHGNITKNNLMTVTGAKGDPCKFSAQADDSQHTKARDYTGTITDYNILTAELNVGSSLLPAWEDQSAQQPSIGASTTLKDTSGNLLKGLDLLVWAEGWDESENAFDKYVDIFTSQGTIITTFEKVKYGSETFKAVRLNSGQNIFGLLLIALKPKLGVRAGVINLKCRLGSTTAVASSPSTYILDPNPASSPQDDDPPQIDILDGMDLKPHDGQTQCTVTFPASSDTTCVGYALTNFVGDTPPANGADYGILEVKTKGEVEYTDTLKTHVKWPLPIASFHPCAQQGQCSPTDLNNLGYMIISEAENNSYSATTPFFVDVFVGNNPTNTNSPYAQPKLFTAKADGTPGTEINPENGDWINDQAIENGLIIRVPDTDVLGQKIQGYVYMNGMNEDGTPEHPPSSRRKRLPLLTTPTKVTAGGLNIPWDKKKVQGFDLGKAPDSGFWVQYWIEGQHDRRSLFYYNPKFDTAPAYN